jgi:hypothetical protein
MVWNDVRLMWDEAEFGGIEVIRIDASHLCSPDVILYNRQRETEEKTVLISNFKGTSIN